MILDTSVLSALETTPLCIAALCQQHSLPRLIPSRHFDTLKVSQESPGNQRATSEAHSAEKTREPKLTGSSLYCQVLLEVHP